jgi:hypothetical protein
LLIIKPISAIRQSPGERLNGKSGPIAVQEEDAAKHILNEELYSLVGLPAIATHQKRDRGRKTTVSLPVEPAPPI